MKSGVQSNEPEPSPLSMKLAPVGKLEVESKGVAPSTSVALTPKVKFIPSVVPFGPMVASTGFWLPASMTVMVTISESVKKPSDA